MAMEKLESDLQQVNKGKMQLVDMNAVNHLSKVLSILGQCPGGFFWPRIHLGTGCDNTAVCGHFGRAPNADDGFSRELTDLVEALKAAV